MNIKELANAALPCERDGEDRKNRVADMLWRHGSGEDQPGVSDLCHGDISTRLPQRAVSGFYCGQMCVDVCGLCYHQRACRSLWAMLQPEVTLTSVVWGASICHLDVTHSAI